MKWRSAGRGAVMWCRREVCTACSEHFGFFVFFFQAEDGIRDLTVTGVQTCALPICGFRREPEQADDLGVLPRAEDDHAIALVGELLCEPLRAEHEGTGRVDALEEIGRASCRERV